MGKEKSTRASNLLLILLVIQNTSTTILARFTRKKYNYDTDQMLFMAEIFKFVASIMLELIDVSIANGKGPHFLGLFQSFQVHIWHNPLDALKLTIPSGLFYLQNSLIYFAISIIPVPLFQITQQTKLVTTALLSLIFLQRKYSTCQWLSIVALCVGSGICVISSSCASRSKSAPGDDVKLSNAVYGLLLMLASNLSSSVASVYFEVVVKRTAASIWMRNVQLSFFSLCIIAARLVMGKDEDATSFFYDFTPIVWIQISTFAFGGLLVASVIKCTDSVRKGLATGLSVISSSAISLVIEPDACNIGVEFISGAAMAVCGCFFFANPVVIAFTTRRKIITSSIVLVSFYWFLYQVSFYWFLYQDVHMVDIQPFLNKIVAKTNLSETPPFWQHHLHVHVHTHGSSTLCGGCRVLHELADSIAEFNISTSRANACPRDDLELVGPLLLNQTIVIVYPEIVGRTCQGVGNRVHVHWILAPLGKSVSLDIFKSWGENDLVFNFGSSCAVYPALLPRSNILQVITNPKPGDEFDYPLGVLERAKRQGTAWIMRKGRRWHPKIDHIHLKLPGPHVEVQHLNASDFLKYEYFVSYDPYTFYSFTAAMSGAVSVVYPLNNVSKRNWVEGTYVGEYLKETGDELPGIAYGVNKTELLYANRTKSQVHDFMLNVRRWGKTVTVERFLKDCYRYGLGERDFQSALLVKDTYTK